MKIKFSAKAILAVMTALSITTTGLAQWSLTGNSGTNPATNFLGTTDDNELVIKTKNIERMRILTGTNSPGGGIAAGTNIRFGTPSTSAGVVVYSQDQAFVTLPITVINNSSGLRWGIPNPFASNFDVTLGRMMRFSASDAFNSHFYDMGIDSIGTFFITENAYPNNAVPAKPFIISSGNNYVGINLAGRQTGSVQNIVPTANLHTNGTVRFQNLPSGTGNILVVDANGNVYRSSGSARTSDDATEIDKLKNDIKTLKGEIESLKKMLYEKGNVTLMENGKEEGFLSVNTPNPFASSTKIQYFLPLSFTGAASINITNVNGQLLKKYVLNKTGNGQIVVDNLAGSSGTIVYSLVLNGKIVDSKKMTKAK